MANEEKIKSYQAKKAGMQARLVQLADKSKKVESKVKQCVTTIAACDAKIAELSKPQEAPKPEAAK